MAGKSRSSTTTRARAGSARGRTTAASRSTQARTTGQRRSPAPRGRTTPARRPVRRTSNTAPLAVISRGISSGWNMLAPRLGATIPAVSRAGEIEHGHRRDGIALALIALSAVIAAAVWLSAGGPIGHWVEAAIRAVSGSASAGLPFVATGIAIVLMRTEARPEIRQRLVLGGL